MNDNGYDRNRVPAFIVKGPLYEASNGALYVRVQYFGNMKQIFKRIELQDGISRAELVLQKIVPEGDKP
jgi:hypothetical protein